MAHSKKSMKPNVPKGPLDQVSRMLDQADRNPVRNPEQIKNLQTMYQAYCDWPSEPSDNPLSQLCEMPLQVAQMRQLRKQLSALGFIFDCKGSRVIATDRVSGHTYVTEGPDSYYSILLVAAQAMAQRLLEQ